jgi:antitoxin component of MazEF toxin-antitoxin module
MRLLLSGGLPMNTPRLISTNRIRRWGGSYVVTLNKEVRQALGIGADDTIAFRKVGRFVFVSVVRAFAVAPISKEEIRQAHEALGS